MAGRDLQAVGDEGVGDGRSDASDQGAAATLAGKLVDPMTSGGLGDESGHGGVVPASERSCSVSYIWEPPPT